MLTSLSTMLDISRKKFFVVLALIIVSFILGIYHNIVLDSLHLSISSLLINSQELSNISILSLTPLIGVTGNSKQKLDPFFVTGFIDAEGCFTIGIEKSKTNIGWAVRAIFHISLHSKDVEILYKIQTFFNNIGIISIRTNRDVAEYRVQDINSIMEILQHFEKFPLLSNKSVDFLLFKRAVELIANKEHLTQSGLVEIISIKSALNLGLSNKLKEAFPQVTSLVRPDYLISEQPLNPNWITGFTEGDGSFIFYLGADRVRAIYSIGLHKREQPLLIKIMEFFGSKGNVNIYEEKDICFYRMQAISDLNSFIVPHFDNYQLHGIKLRNFLLWRSMLELITKKLHLTPEGKAKLIELKSKYNI